MAILTSASQEKTQRIRNFGETTGSAIVGLPGYKVFAPPDTYSILGLDVSSSNADIDWAQVATAPKVKFAYIRATTLRPENRKDREFDRNWLGAHAAGLKRGAYHTYDAHLSALEQFKIIKASIPLDPDALPLAIDPEATFYSMINTNTTIAPNDSTALEELPKLQKLCGDYFGKPTVLYRTRKFLKLWGDRFGSENAIWFARYTPPDGKAISPTAESLPGNQPWTLWQFTDSATIAGIKGKSDLNAFFGTLEQFNSFARGDKSVALNAALRPPSGK
jgi:lysozyme